MWPAEQLMPGVSPDVMKSDYHKWTAGLSKEQIHQQIDFYKEGYQTVAGRVLAFLCVR